ncbi:MAG: hypothetical protein AAF297_04045 [Planctomycetota bacterium]
MSVQSSSDRRRSAGRALPGLSALAAAATVAVVVSAAPAQDDARSLRPPQPEREPESPAFLTVATLLLISAGLIGASLLPSKRGHQD